MFLEFFEGQISLYEFCCKLTLLSGYFQDGQKKQTFFSKYMFYDVLQVILGIERENVTCIQIRFDLEILRRKDFMMDVFNVTKVSDEFS